MGDFVKNIAEQFNLLFDAAKKKNWLKKFGGLMSQIDYIVIIKGFENGDHKLFRRDELKCKQITRCQIVNLEYSAFFKSHSRSQELKWQIVAINYSGNI